MLTQVTWIDIIENDLRGIYLIHDINTLQS